MPLTMSETSVSLSGYAANTRWQFMAIKCQKTGSTLFDESLLKRKENIPR